MNATLRLLPPGPGLPVHRDNSPNPAMLPPNIATASSDIASAPPATRQRTLALHQCHGQRDIVPIHCVSAAGNAALTRSNASLHLYIASALRTSRQYYCALQQCINTTRQRHRLRVSVTVQRDSARYIASAHWHIASARWSLRHCAGTLRHCTGTLRRLRGRRGLAMGDFNRSGFSPAVRPGRYFVVRWRQLVVDGRQTAVPGGRPAGD